MIERLLHFSHEQSKPVAFANLLVFFVLFRCSVVVAVHFLSEDVKPFERFLTIVVVSNRWYVAIF